jgi:acyl-CoA-dependent ceramide synthase
VQTNTHLSLDLPLLILSSLLVLDFLGVEEARLFTRLQYRQPNTHPLDAFSPVTTLTGVYYRGGYKDIFFVLYMSLGLTLFRASVMRYILEPLGRRLHIRNVNKLERFKEQGYIFLYYSISWAMGMYLMYHSPHWFDTKHFWINYPHRDMTWHFKLYYLTSLAYAVHLVYVLQVEARRKDYAAMFAHHIVTIMLLACSYITCFTRIGNAILCMMDFADILLAVSHHLSYYIPYTNQNHTSLLNVYAMLNSNVQVM